MNISKFFLICSLILHQHHKKRKAEGRGRKKKKEGTEGGTLYLFHEEGETQKTARESKRTKTKLAADRPRSDERERGAQQ